MAERETHTHVRETLRERLTKLEVVEGVLPTPPRRSERLQDLSRGFREQDTARTEVAAREHVSAAVPEGALAPATEIFAGEGLREQAAGYADAGIAFYFADAEMMASTPTERGARGANGSVSRVLVSDERLYLETPRIVVRFDADMDKNRLDTLAARHHLAVIGGAGLPQNTVRASVGDGLAREVALALLDEPGVVHAAPDLVEHIDRRFTPIDVEYANQWHHENIRSEKAWLWGKGANIRVAVIDNGFRADHPDLAGRLDPASGWFRQSPDFLDADFVPGTEHMPDGNHGTACAGILGGRTVDESGGCGVAFEVALAVIACLKDQVGPQSTLAYAIRYAALTEGDPTGEGVDIISCSLGPNSASWAMAPVLEDAINDAASLGRGGKGCAIFWAATNGNFPIGSDEVCSHPETITVGRSTKHDTDDGSGFGPQLEFLAPGRNVWIPKSPSGFHSTTGTSFAAPLAAGVAALALAQAPDMTAHELRQTMRDSCDKIGPLPYLDGRNARFGHGRVNAESAVVEARKF